MKFPCLATYRHCRSKSAAPIQPILFEKIEPTCKRGSEWTRFLHKIPIGYCFVIWADGFASVQRESLEAQKDKNEDCQNDP
jgi:hypothetical protein